MSNATQPPLFLARFSPKFRPFSAILRPFSPSRRQEAGQRRKTGGKTVQNGRKTAEKERAGWRWGTGLRRWPAASSSTSQTAPLPAGVATEHSCSEKSASLSDGVPPQPSFPASRSPRSVPLAHAQLVWCILLCVCGSSVIGPTFFRPFLAHFTSFFPRFFAVPSIWPSRFQKPAPRPRNTVRNGRETVAKRGSKTV